MVPQLALIIVLLLLWELASYHLYNPFWGSRPGMITERLFELALSGHLWLHTSITLLEAAAGLLLAAIVGVPVGIGLACAPRLARLLDPIIMGLYGLPRVALAPLLFCGSASACFPKSPCRSPW